MSNRLRHMRPYLGVGLAALVVIILNAATIFNLIPTSWHLPSSTLAVLASAIVFVLYLRAEVRRTGDIASTEHRQDVARAARAVSTNIGAKHAISFASLDNDARDPDFNERALIGHFPELRHEFARFTKLVAQENDARETCFATVDAVQTSMHLDGDGLKSFLQYTTWASATGGEKSIERGLKPEWDRRADGSIWTVGPNPKLVASVATDDLENALTAVILQSLHWKEVRHWRSLWKKSDSLRQSIMAQMADISRRAVLRGSCDFC